MINPRFFKAVIAMGVVSACLLGLPACQSNSASTGGTAATVNGTEISEDTVTTTIQTLRVQSGLEDQDTWGEFLASSSMTPESVRDQIVDSLVSQELVKQGAAELGVTVDSSEVDQYVESMKGYFESDEAWEQALAEAGFTEESYRESIESSLLTQAVGEYFEEKAELTDEDVLDAAKTYATYYDGAKRSSHVLFKVDDTTDEAAMEAARTEAQSVLDQINGGLDFAEAAKQYSSDTSASNGGDVGWDATSSFVTEYQSALDALEAGQVSGLVETQYGIHIIKCTEVFKAPDEITSVDQIPADFLESIKSYAKSLKSNNDYTEWVDALREKAEIVINDMPSSVPYNVDMSKYATEDDTASDDTATDEAASDEAASESSTSAEVASESSESASAESESSSSAAA